MISIIFPDDAKLFRMGDDISCHIENLAASVSADSIR